MKPRKDLANEKFEPRNILEIAHEISKRVNEFIETNNNIKKKGSTLIKKLDPIFFNLHTF